MTTMLRQALVKQTAAMVQEALNQSRGIQAQVTKAYERAQATRLERKSVELKPSQPRASTSL